MPRASLARSGRWSGEWWLPDETERIAGTLTYTPDEGLTLELIGGGWEYRNLVEVMPGVLMHQRTKKDWPLVYGVAKGERFTLRAVQLVDVTAPTSNRPSGMTFRVEVALVGEHVSEKAAEHITRVRFEVENLSQLIGVTGITSNWNVTPDGHAPDGSGSVVMESLPPVEIPVPLGLVRLVRWYDLPGAKATKAGFVGTLAEAVCADILLDEPVTLDRAFELADVIRQLASLGSLEDCAVISMQTEMPFVERDWPADHPEAAKPAILDVLFRPTRPPHPDDQAARAHDFVLVSSQVAPEIFIPAWFDLYDAQASALGLLVDVLTGASHSISARVLGAVSAAEAFHAGTNPEPPLPQEEFDELLSIVLANVPEEHGKWVENRFPTNRHSLRQRLRDLADGLDTDIRAALHLDAREWLQGATAARNKVAHTGNTGRTDLEVLDAVTEVTATVVLIHVLFALGVSKPAVLELFDTHWRFRRTASASRRYLSRTRAVGPGQMFQEPKS